MNRNLDKVKLKMAELGITQAEIARELGISRQYVGFLIKGVRRSGNFERRIAKILDMEWAEAFTVPEKLQPETEDYWGKTS